MTRTSQQPSMFARAWTIFVISLLLLAGLQLLAHLHVGASPQPERFIPLPALRRCGLTYATIVAWVLAACALVFVFRQAQIRRAMAGSSAFATPPRRKTPAVGLRWWEFTVAIIPILLIFPLGQIRFLAQDRCAIAPTLPHVLNHYPIFWMTLIVLYSLAQSKRGINADP